VRVALVFSTVFSKMKDFQRHWAMMFCDVVEDSLALLIVKWQMRVK